MPDTDVIEAVRRNLERCLSPDVVNELRCADPSGSEDLVSGLVEAFAERELASEMVSYRRNVTGVDHTVFISPRGLVRHGPRIKVAIDPADTLSPFGKTAAVDFNGTVVAGTVEPELLRQVQRFIELNRDALLAYWDYQIDTDELRKRLRSI